MNFERYLEDPMELMRGRFGFDPYNITYDPSLWKGDYSIVRQQTHDGTFSFIFEMQAKIFGLLLLRRSFHVANPPDLKRLRDIRYTIGKLRTAVVYGLVKLPCSDTILYPGQRERYRLPVKVEYIYDAV